MGRSDAPEGGPTSVQEDTLAPSVAGELRYAGTIAPPTSVQEDTLAHDAAAQSGEIILSS
jgi:hypothetical protein